MGGHKCRWTQGYSANYGIIAGSLSIRGSEKFRVVVISTRRPNSAPTFHLIGVFYSREAGLDENRARFSSDLALLHVLRYRAVFPRKTDESYGGKVLSRNNIESISRVYSSAEGEAGRRGILTCTPSVPTPPTSRFIFLLPATCLFTFAHWRFRALRARSTLN